MACNPGRIVVAGDWHANTAWACSAIVQAGKALAEEEVRILLHLGDFGFWHGSAGTQFLRSVSEACYQGDVTLLVVRGNHENPEVTRRHSILEPIRVSRRIRWLPDGYRWQWHGREWVAAGGAVSPDRVLRKEGLSWWPEEELSEEDALQIMAGGPADVLVSHDVGDGVNLALPPWPRGWDYADLTRGERHRSRLQAVADSVKPSYWMHGHYHRVYQQMCDFGYGPVRVTGLDMDGTPGNWAVLDVRTMEWGRDEEGAAEGS